MPTEDGKLSMDEMLHEAAGGEPTPEEPTPEEPTPEEPTPEEPTPADPKPADPKPNPMKDIRDKLNAEKAEREKISRAITRFGGGSYEFKLSDHMEDGVINYETLTEAMDKVDNENKAKDTGLTPEVQAEIDRIEKEKVELQKQRLQISMDKALTNLQIDLKISSNEINNFFKDSMDQKKNPYQWLAQGGTLKDLYNIVYADKITQARIDEAVAAKVAELTKGNPRATPPAGNPARQQQGGTGGNEQGVSLKELLNEAAAKTK